MTPEVAAHLARSALGREAFTRIAAAHPEAEVRVTRSQVAFRRRRGFAWLWLPGRYLQHPQAEVVLSFALGRRLDSPRLKEVVHPSPRHWVHHLELRAADDVDDEVLGWLAEAADRA